MSAAPDGRKSVLLVLPQEGYDAGQFRYTWTSLRSRGVNCRVASPVKDKAVGGIDFYYPEVALDQADPAGFDAVLFIGGPGAEKLWANAHAQLLAQKVASRGGLVGGIGTGVVVLGKAGLLQGARVTGDSSCKGLLQELGARYSGSQVEPRWLRSNPKKIVTAVDTGAAIRFGQRVARDLGL